jgi:menaquinone-dependent protoporphyrinogen oxidase
VHERRHPRGFEAYVRTHRMALAARPTLMLSVSLSAAFPELREDAEDYLTEMEMRTGFTAGKSELVAGAVRSGSYDYFQKMVVRNVVLRGHEPGPEDAEREFTDWAALQKTVDGFLAGD